MSKMYHAVIMAAQRVGEENPVAKAAGVSHKCLALVGGKPLVQNVLETLDACSRISGITVVVEDRAVLGNVPLFVDLEASGRARFRPSAQNLTDSLMSGLEGLDEKTPTLVATGDNALLLPEQVVWFLDQVEASGTDASLAMTKKAVTKDKYPDGECNFLKFLDGEFSNANLYALMNDQALAAAEMFRNGAQFGKKPERATGSMGKIPGWLFQKALIPRGMLLFLGRFKFGLKLGVVDMPWAESPIDVDDGHTMALANQILATRAAEAAAASPKPSSNS